MVDMSKYKVGDKVLLEGEILEIDKGTVNPYKIKFYGGWNWFDKSCLLNKSKTYEDGLADAWELARKIENKLDIPTAREIFDAYRIADILDNFTPQEALAKIEAYEESKVIKVGDMVYADGVQGVVIDITSDEECYIYNENGCIEEHWFKDLKKTGRHLDIEHLLEQIRGDQ